MTSDLRNETSQSQEKSFCVTDHNNVKLSQHGLSGQTFLMANTTVVNKMEFDVLQHFEHFEPKFSFFLPFTHASSWLIWGKPHESGFAPS